MRFLADQPWSIDSETELCLSISKLFALYLQNIPGPDSSSESQTLGMHVFFCLFEHTTLYPLSTALNSVWHSCVSQSLTLYLFARYAAWDKSATSTEAAQIEREISGLVDVVLPALLFRIQDVRERAKVGEKESVGKRKARANLKHVVDRLRAVITLGQDLLTRMAREEVFKLLTPTREGFSGNFFADSPVSTRMEVV